MDTQPQPPWPFSQVLACAAAVRLFMCARCRCARALVMRDPTSLLQVSSWGVCMQSSGRRAPAKEGAVHAQVIGCAIALSLLTWGAVPLWAGVLVTAVDSFALLLIERLGVRNLEAVFAVLITTMAISFGVMYVLAGVPTAEVVEGAWQVQGLSGWVQGSSCVEHVCLRACSPRRL